MTHSLHRRGTPESLKDDFVILATAASGINHEGSKDKLRSILDIIYGVGPANIGSYDTGTVMSGATFEEIREKLNEVPRVRCCFSSKEKIREVVRQIKEADLGISITISGLIDDVLDLARSLDIKPHSINLSLNIWGRTDKLPPEEVLEFVTMCGHGLISSYLVEKAIESVKKGTRTPAQAAKLIAPPCICGIFNPVRAEELFKRYVPAGVQKPV